MRLLRVSYQTHPMEVAKAIASMIHKNNHAEVQAIGVGTVHQTLKGVTQAVAYFKEKEGIQLGFTVTLIEPGADGNNEKAGFRFIIEPFTPLNLPEVDEDRCVEYIF